MGKNLGGDTEFTTKDHNKGLFLLQKMLKPFWIETMFGKHTRGTPIHGGINFIHRNTAVSKCIKVYLQLAKLAFLKR